MNQLWKVELCWLKNQIVSTDNTTPRSNQCSIGLCRLKSRILSTEKSDCVDWKEWKFTFYVISCLPNPQITTLYLFDLQKKHIVQQLLLKAFQKTLFKSFEKSFLRPFKRFLDDFCFPKPQIDIHPLLPSWQKCMNTFISFLVWFVVCASFSFPSHLTFKIIGSQPS